MHYHKHLQATKLSISNILRAQPFTNLRMFRHLQCQYQYRLLASVCEWQLTWPVRFLIKSTSTKTYISDCEKPAHNQQATQSIAQLTMTKNSHKPSDEQETIDLWVPLTPINGDLRAVEENNVGQSLMEPDVRAGRGFIDFLWCRKYYTIKSKRFIFQCILLAAYVEKQRRSRDRGNGAKVKVKLAGSP